MTSIITSFLNGIHRLTAPRTGIPKIKEETTTETRWPKPKGNYDIHSMRYHVIATMERIKASHPAIITSGELYYNTIIKAVLEALEMEEYLGSQDQGIDHYEDT